MHDLEIKDFKIVGEHTGDVAVAAFEDAADEQGGAVPHDRIVAAPESDRADDVEHAGFVFEVEEGDAACGGGALAVGDGAADEGAGAGLDVGEDGDREGRRGG